MLFRSQGGVECTGPKVGFTVTINAVPKVVTDLENLSICENNDVVVVVAAEEGANYVWEYKINESETIWQTLNNATVPGVVIISGSTLTISHSTMNLNGSVVRLKVDNGSCEALSNQFTIEVRDCRAITNPILPNKTN